MNKLADNMGFDETVEYLAVPKSTYDRLLAERKEMLELLREVEWVQTEQTECSCCHNGIYSDTKHASDCRLAAMIAKLQSDIDLRSEAE
jgi:hypothetical protein